VTGRSADVPAEPTPTCAAIVVAAGAGIRMGAAMPKALMPVGGRALAAWCLDALAASDRIGSVVVVAPGGHEAELAHALGLAVDQVVTGGSSRAESVGRGLTAVDRDADLVLVHDAARPLIRPELIAAVIAAAMAADGAIAAAPLADTPKRVSDDHVITATPSRAGLWLAQTPQVFWREVLERAFDRARSEDRLDTATDCASLVEADGGRVVVVPSLWPNLKVTTPSDLRIAELLLADTAPGRVR
jgi:2-C-methyl-D-erythritol 4-phosphate cytidylyltransferase